MWNNNGVNMLLLVFELLDIIINPTSEKKIKKINKKIRPRHPSGQMGPPWVIINHE